ncbi:hypothetical protein B0H19DRAFT_1378776 [Mycena capillaripes]|nr:hypothetical protein B0H19DRAFT_1378776 [Mycena capillaripes]
MLGHHMAPTPLPCEGNLLKNLRGESGYYHVIVQVTAAIADVEDLVSALAFRELEVFEVWKDLFPLAQDRIEFLENLSSDLSPKACDNIPACQIDDWQCGGHRQVCSSYGPPGTQCVLTIHYRAARLKSVVIGRERAPIRALLHHGYRTHRRDTLTQQVQIMAAQPDCPFFTSFDYFGGRVKIGFRDTSGSRARAGRDKVVGQPSGQRRPDPTAYSTYYGGQQQADLCRASVHK